MNDYEQSEREQSEQEQNAPEFSLDDILKEFAADDAHEVSELSAEEILDAALTEAGVRLASEEEEDVKIAEAPEKTPEQAADTEPEKESPMTGDTIRVDMGNTQRIDGKGLGRLRRKASKRKAEPEVAETLPEEPKEPEREAEPEKPEEAEEAEEAFSGEWEPSYEQPIGEYIPPQPIVFKPRSRLKELKSKLVAGPEKRYYELMGMGLGRLQAAIFLTFVVVAISVGALVLHAMDMVQPDRMRLLVFGEVLCMLLAALLGCQQMLRGVANLFRGSFTPDTMLAFTFAMCCADGVICLQELHVPYCAAFCLQMLMALWAEYQRRNAQIGQMDTMRKATRLDSVVRAGDFYDGRPGLLRGEGQVEDFMDEYHRTTGPEKVMSWYLFIAFIVAVGGGVAAGLIFGYQTGIRLATAAMLAALPVSGFVTLSRPAAVLERQLHRVGAVLCGWQGVKGMCGHVTVPLKDEDLFPAGSVKMNGVKFFGPRDPDQVVAYATAVIAAEGGGLTSLFNQLLDSRNGRHYDVENFRAYNGGVGGEVNEEAVLIGTHSFLREMGMEVPEGTRVQQAVYVAIDGVLCGVFAITYSKVRSCVSGLRTLCGYRRLTPVMTCGDFMLTDGFIRSRFGVNTRRIAFPSHSDRKVLADRDLETEAKALALTTNLGIKPVAFAIVGARALYTASILGTVLHILAGTLGLSVVAVLTVVNATGLLTAENLLLFHLAWMIPGLLITEWTRGL